MVLQIFVGIHYDNDEVGGGCGELAGLGAWCKMVFSCNIRLVQLVLLYNCNGAVFDDDKDGKNNDDDVDQPIIFTFQCLKPTVQGIFTRLVS